MNGPSEFWTRDTPSYVEPAESLLHGSFSKDGRPELVRTPGYPLLIAPAIAAHHPVLLGVFENWLLAAISAWLVWRITSELVPDSTAGLFAVTFYCLEPLGVLYSEKLVSELLFTTQLLLFVWLTVRFLRSPTHLNLVSSAVALGLATYTRPVPLFLGLGLAPFFLLFPRQLSWFQRSARASAFALTFMITLAPWVIRNVAVTGYQGFSAITDYNLYFYSEAAVKSKVEHKSYAQAQEELGFEDWDAYFRAHLEQRNWPAARVLQFQRTEGWQTISQHPLVYAKIHLRGCAIVLLDPAATELMRTFRMYPDRGGLIYRATDQGLVKAILWLIRQYPAAGMALLLLGLQLLLYYALGIAGLRILPLPTGVFFVLLFVYFVAVSGSSTATARFRMPVMPLVCVSSGIASAEWRVRRRRKSVQTSSQSASSIH